MIECIQKYNVVTAPFGHSEEYKDGIHLPNMNRDHPSWGSRGQDKTFFDLKKGSRLVLGFKKLRTLIYCTLVDDPQGHLKVQPFEELHVYYDVNNKPFKIASPKAKAHAHAHAHAQAGTVFRPYVRDIKIDWVVEAPKHLDLKDVGMGSVNSRKLTNRIVQYYYDHKSICIDPELDRHVEEIPVFRSRPAPVPVRIKARVRPAIVEVPIRRVKARLRVVPV
jgi:hypothetical protein